MAKSARTKPFHEPPIQKRHIGYGTALPLVRSGVTRFHRIERVEGIENLGDPNAPAIFIGNHQNGLMDPLVLCSLRSPHQIHWLTRADIFYQRIARALLFSFNQMPIFRQRDRLSDARERNERVFEICAERLNIGASIGLFPEGNHRAVKSLRMLRRGVADMVNQAIKLNPELKSLQLIPVGIDYEEMESLRRRLTYRIGPAIPFEDLIQPDTGQIVPGDLLIRIHAAMNELMVNIQPESHYGCLLPYVQALRTTESSDWETTRDAVRSLAECTEDQLASIQSAYDDLCKIPEFRAVRTEDLGRNSSSLRKTPWWLWPAAPFAAAGGAMTWPLAKLIELQAKKRVKDPCFTSTFKVSAGMFMFPVYWFILAWPLGWMFTGSWGGWGLLAGYLFNLVGSRIAGSWYGVYLDWRGRSEAKTFYANSKLAALWKRYVETIETATASVSSSTTLETADETLTTP